MNKTIGFIGAGNMGQAIVGGIIKSKLITSDNIILSDLNEANLSKAKERYNVNITNDNKVVAKEADILILGVKPNQYKEVIDEIKEIVKNEVIIVSIAAGKSISDIEDMFERQLKVVRAMPNTPALVGGGMSALCANKHVNATEIEDIVTIFESFGEAEVINEKLMDSVVAVSGSSPAYVYMFIEAMADAAVLEGMSRNQAYKFAAQTVMGAAKMVLETKMHPGVLKDMVCSPSGTTIEAVAMLEEKGFRSAVISAMKVAADKSREMSK